MMTIRRRNPAPTGMLSLVINKLFTLVKSTTVEPISVLVFLSTQLYFITLNAGLYQVVCYQLYNDPELKSNSTIDCNSKHLDIKIQNGIQQELARWTIILALSHFVTGMVSSCLMGALGDIYGRKPNLLLSIFGMLLCVVVTPIVFEYKFVSLWWIAAMNIVGSTFGYIIVIMLSCYAYLCDRILDKKDISIKMTMFSALMSVSNIIGSMVSGLLLGNVSLSTCCIVAEVLLVVAFFYTLIVLESLTPTQMRQKILLEQNRLSLNTPLPEINFAPKDDTTDITGNITKTNQQAALTKKQQKQTFAEMCKYAINQTKDLFKEIINTYTKPRPNHDRAFLAFTTVILFFQMMADNGLLNTVLGAYVFRHPFNWTDGSQLGYWKAAKGVLNFIGNVGGILLFKKVLEMRDTTIMLISAASAICELIIIAFSSASWMLYLAIVVGSLSNLVMPVIGSFISQIVHYTEIGKSFTVHGITASLAFMLSAGLFSSIYKATLDFMPGFVFLFGAGIMFVCFCIVLWIHVLVLKREAAKKAIDSKT